MNKILEYDLKNIHSKFCQDNFQDSTVLVTGCAGFLGYYFMNYFTKYAEELKIKKIIGLDNFMLNKPNWLKNISLNSKLKENSYAFHNNVKRN